MTCKEFCRSFTSKFSLLVNVKVGSSQGTIRNPLSLRVPSMESVSSWTPTATVRHEICRGNYSFEMTLRATHMRQMNPKIVFGSNLIRGFLIALFGSSREWIFSLKQANNLGNSLCIGKCQMKPWTWEPNETAYASLWGLVWKHVHCSFTAFIYFCCEQRPLLQETYSEMDAMLWLWTTVQKIRGKSTPVGQSEPNEISHCRDKGKVSVKRWAWIFQKQFYPEYFPK